MIAMGSLRKSETIEEINTGVNSLSKCFKVLTVDHKRVVLKTAQGLLRIQRADKTMSADNTWHISLDDKEEKK
jgi:hypothetical protein